ncbi:hypothetical protein HN51_031468 [Arachis hypogaea]
MSNPTTVAHAAVSEGATIGLGTTTGLGAPSIPAALKHPRTPPTNPSIDYPSRGSDHVSKRTRPMGMSDEVNLHVNVLSATFPGHGHGQAFNAPYDLPKTVMRTLNQGSSPMSMDFHPVQQTILLVGTNVGDIALWEVGSRERLVLRNFKAWDLSAYSMPFQAALVKDPGVSVNRVIWSPDGALFGVSYSRHIVHIVSSTLPFLLNMRTTNNNHQNDQSAPSSSSSPSVLKWATHIMRKPAVPSSHPDN